MTVYGPLLVCQHPVLWRSGTTAHVYSASNCCIDLTMPGLPKVVVAAWFGLLAPAATPPDVIRRLNEAYAAAVRSPRTRKRIDALGYEPVDDAPSHFALALRDEIGAVRATLGPGAGMPR